MEGDVKEVGSKGVNLEAVGMDTVLKKGFGGKGAEYESRATDVQLSFERWVLKDQHYASLARKAFSSHIRAYATHPSDEKHLFHVRNLHLGHLAKAFALREAPSAVSTNKGNGKGAKGKASGSARKPSKKHSKALDSDDEVDVGEAEKRMEKAVREQGRLTRKGGKMVSSGHSEFQITGGYNLESLMNGSRT
ncbi:hypothetical protein QCA50_004630 [Cerrena zonata]|uniref:ATP-dependent rRNA helicase SPB4-like C-terminal extension domain-containing protein n=1 Tax=Cerrena zonata TaxID=2478898 RepID=A0AAW0GS09_9APHY